MDGSAFTNSTFDSGLQLLVQLNSMALSEVTVNTVFCDLFLCACFVEVLEALQQDEQKEG